MLYSLFFSCYYQFFGFCLFYSDQLQQQPHVIYSICILIAFNCHADFAFFSNTFPFLDTIIWQVEIYSRCYKDSPLVIQGAGAGNDTTAAGVLADIIDLQDLFH